MIDLSEEVKRQLNIVDVLRFYGMELNRANALCCPFHNEKTPSFKVYAEGTKYKCFGCGESGDVITFVMKYFDIDFKQAISRLDYDFNLCLPITTKLTIKQRRAQRLALKHRQEKKAHIEFLKLLCGMCFEELCSLEKLKRDNEPTDVNTVNESYIYALKNIEYWEYLTNYLESEVEKCQK